MISFDAGELDWSDLIAELENIPSRAASTLKRAFGTLGDTYAELHRQERRDGRPGLIMRSGGGAGMRRATQTVVVGDRLDTIVGAVFWGPQVAKYIRVHEYGAVIKPVRAKMLHFKLPDGSWRFAKSVTIPPRLRWFATWDGASAASLKQKVLSEALDQIASEPGGSGA